MNRKWPRFLFFLGGGLKGDVGSPTVVRFVAHKVSALAGQAPLDLKRVSGMSGVFLCKHQAPNKNLSSLIKHWI